MLKNVRQILQPPCEILLVHSDASNGAFCGMVRKRELPAGGKMQILRHECLKSSQVPLALESAF